MIMEQTIEDSKETLVRMETNLCDQIKMHCQRIGKPITTENFDLSIYTDNGFYDNVTQIRIDEEGEVAFDGNFEGFEEISLEDAVSDGYLSTWDLIAIVENLQGCDTIV
jgi:hypothetical protein